MISYLIPSRNRQQGLNRAVKSAFETADNPHKVEFVIYVDEDNLDHYLNKPPFGEYPNVHLIIGPRITLSDCWNKCFDASHGDIVAMGNDDIVWKTHGWDSITEEAFNKSEDKILMVHGSPGAAPAPCGFAAHPAIHRTWPECVGYFTWPHFSGDYADTFIDWIARELGRAELLPYALEHIHPLFQKGADDQTYRDRHEFHRKQNPSELWEKSLPDRLAAIEKLRSVMR